MIRALLWKEWKENGWKLLFATALLVGISIISFRSRMLPDQGTMMLVLLIGSELLPLFAAMGIVASEREAKTLGFLTALPIAGSRILRVKLLAAIAVSSIP